MTSLALDIKHVVYFVHFKVELCLDAVRLCTLVWEMGLR